jgi:hypothetical protein
MIVTGKRVNNMSIGALWSVRLQCHSGFSVFVQAVVAQWHCCCSDGVVTVSVELQYCCNCIAFKCTVLHTLECTVMALSYFDAAVIYECKNVY